jgi:uncharacterized protein
MKKKALMVWGGWDGHEPKQGMEIFASYLEGEGYDVTVSDTLDIYRESEWLKTLSLIVPIWTMGRIEPEPLNALCAAVRSGVGLAGWHGCMCDSFREATEYQFMTGGQWVAHPGNIIRYRVEVTDRTDPVMEGIGDFEMNSEQYYLHVDPSNQVLATTTFTGEHAAWIDGCVMPVVWKRRYGTGRVFYSALGHVARDFEVPEAKRIMQRGLLWASR